MQNFKNRKFLLLLMLGAAVFFCRVLLPAAALPYLPIIAAAAALFFFAVGGGFCKKWASLVFAAFLALSCVLASFYGAGVKARSESALSFATGEVLWAEARVTEVSFTSAYASSYLVEVTRVGESETKFGAVLEIEKGTSFEYGDIISFEAVFSEAKEEKAYLRSKNIFVSALAENAARKGKAEKDFLYSLREQNEALSKRFVSLMGKDEGGLCAALILGNKDFVAAGTKLNFSRAGISHLLALSGLHLSVVSGTLDFILKGFMKKRLRGVILIASSFAFALFTGLSASVLRAAVMLAFVYAAELFGEENDPLSALFAAVWVILLVNGNAVYDVGFLLSVSATLGIILTTPAAERAFSFWRNPRGNVFLRFVRAVVKYFYGIFTMSAAAFAFTLPIIGFFFGEVSVAGIFTNFLFLPLASVLIVSCAAFIPLSFLPAAAGFAAEFCAGAARLILSLAEWVSDIRGVSVSLRYPFVPWLLALLAAALIACVFARRLSLRALFAGASSFVLLFFVCFGAYSGMTSGDMLVYAGSGKSGEYAAFSAGGENYVVDISTGGYSFMQSELESREFFCHTEIDNLVLTHYHNHHSGAIDRLCRGVKLRNVLLPKPETEKEEENFAYICAVLEKHGVPFEVYERGSSYGKGGVTISFAPMRKISRSEKPIVAFTFRYNGASFSYIEGAAAESAFDYSEHLSAQTVFVGAHGPARKFGVYADVFENAGRVIFAEGARELFRGTEYLARAYDIGDYGGRMTVLYGGNAE